MQGGGDLEFHIYTYSEKWFFEKWQDWEKWSVNYVI